ncbi:MAG: enoyl-CoA hydratase-related protein [Micavibrio sp.]|nr:enoyl-CoA hydratase-related protein [Micavibrio sp.]
MEDTHILQCRDGGFLHLALNRADKKNALTNAMYRDLTAALNDAAADEDIIGVVFTGMGDAFTAGNDLKEFLAAGTTAGLAAPDFLRVLATFPKIVIAAVQGAAVGIGTTLLLHCDLVIAAPDAKFQLPFINLGLVPEAASSLLLPARLGHARASELLLLGSVFDAQTAYQLGLINRIVEKEALAKTVLEFTAALASKDPHALQETKRLLKSMSQGVEARMEEEFTAFARCLGMPAFKTAVEKFFKPKA